MAPNWFTRLFTPKRVVSPKRKSPSPKRKSPRRSPNVQRSAALGPFWNRPAYAKRNGPLRRTF